MKKKEWWLLVLSVGFCVLLILANLLEIKVFQVCNVDFTAGLLVFPISYIINDCLSEVWGFRCTSRIILLGFTVNLCFVLLLNAAAALPPSPGWDGAIHFNYIFNFAPRIVIASLTAFLAGSYTNAYIMKRMKERHSAANSEGFAARAILSTILGETLDSFVFFPIAFLGALDLGRIVQIACIQIVLKSLYEILILPVTTRVVLYLKTL
ncbi:MAG: queuosine precursor transporter [Bacteroidaceae bacterium]|nr:queuosine precursor transporter [Bacteroidaceae bacterium]